MGIDPNTSINDIVVKELQEQYSECIPDHTVIAEALSMINSVTGNRFDTVFDEWGYNLQNTYIDQWGQSGKRATILSIANMVGNLLEVVFLFSSAYIVNIGNSACFASAGIMLIVFGFLCAWALRGNMPNA